MILLGFEPRTPAVSEQCSSQAELQDHRVEKQSGDFRETQTFQRSLAELQDL